MGFAKMPHPLGAWIWVTWSGPGDGVGLTFKLNLHGGSPARGGAQLPEHGHRLAMGQHDELKGVGKQKPSTQIGGATDTPMLFANM